MAAGCRAWLPLRVYRHRHVLRDRRPYFYAEHLFFCVGCPFFFHHRRGRHFTAFLTLMGLSLLGNKVVLGCYCLAIFDVGISVFLCWLVLVSKQIGIKPCAVK